MLVTFRSTATGPITMFADVATPLLKMMGASGRVPGALSAADVPAALKQLEAAIQRLKADGHAATAAPPAMNEDWSADEEDEKNQDPPVELITRAVPLISLLQRAVAEKAEVSWG